MVNLFDADDPLVRTASSIAGNIRGLTDQLGWDVGLDAKDNTAIVTVDTYYKKQVAELIIHPDGIIVKGFDGSQTQKPLNKPDDAAMIARKLIIKETKENPDHKK